MSATLGCPICRRNSWLTVDGLAHHLERDHSPRIVAEYLAKRVTEREIPRRYPDDPDNGQPRARAPLAPGECPTRKLRYATEREARVELCGAIVGRNRGKNQRRETRVYPCPSCGGWHLTSMEEPPAVAS